LGLADIIDNIEGFENDLRSRPIRRGKAPIVFDAINTAGTITRYLQKLFLPLKVDSRWFMRDLLIRIP
jgi:hypothetical protein